MSTTIETNTPAWRKRHHDEDKPTQMDIKRPRYYFRLESESSKASEEDAESVYSLQDRETDVVRDTSDTDSKSECSQDEYEVIEYEVASLSGSENEEHSLSSSGSEDMILAAAAAAICDSSLETWITDCEESDNSSLEETSSSKSGFNACAQCKSPNDNPLYRYCEKCFQDRKKFFPPRPRGNRKSRKTKKKPDPPVKLDTLRSCLSGLSQDSGIGSSQDCPALDLDQIVVPDQHLRAGTSRIKNSGTDVKSNITIEGHSRKRQLSESSVSDIEVKKPKFKEKPPSSSQTSDLGSEVNSSSGSLTLEKTNPENSELCMFCNSAPKDSIFLHTNIAHQCCCYKCAKRTLQTTKRCPICNRPVNKIVKIYTS